jgi:hypothetical protein
MSCRAGLYHPVAVTQGCLQPAQRHASLPCPPHLLSTYSASSMRLLFFSRSVARPPIQVLPATTRPVERPVRLWPKQAPPNAMLMKADRNRLDLQPHKTGHISQCRLHVAVLYIPCLQSYCSP